MHRGAGVGGDIASCLASVDHRDATAVHRDRLALGVQLHPGGGLCGILHHANVAFVRSLGDLDGLTDELSVSSHPTTSTSSPTTSEGAAIPASATTLTLIGVRAAQPWRHHAWETSTSTRCLRTCRATSTSSSKHQVAALADKDTAIVQHHPAVEESIVSEQMFNLALSTRVWSIDALNDVPTLDRILLAVQGGGLLVLPLLLKTGRLHGNNLAVHVQHLEALLLDLNDHPHSLRINLDQVSKLVLTQGVNSCGHVGAELEVLGHRLELVHREVGEENNQILFHANNQSCVALISASNHPHMVALWSNMLQNCAHKDLLQKEYLTEVFLQFVALELERILQVVVFRHDGYLGAIDGNHLQKQAMNKCWKLKTWSPCPAGSAARPR